MIFVCFHYCPLVESFAPYYREGEYVQKTESGEIIKADVNYNNSFFEP